MQLQLQLVRRRRRKALRVSARLANGHRVTLYERGGVGELLAVGAALGAAVLERLAAPAAAAPPRAPRARIPRRALTPGRDAATMSPPRRGSIPPGRSSRTIDLEPGEYRVLDRLDEEERRRCPS